jgi:hypothetical protein
MAKTVYLVTMLIDEDWYQVFKDQIHDQVEDGETVKILSRDEVDVDE